MQELSSQIGAALDAGDLDSAVFLIVDFRLRCGYSQSQQRSLGQAYRLMFSWAVDHNAKLPLIILDSDMDSVEGALINQALVEVVIVTHHADRLDSLASLCEQMCKSIIRHGQNTLEEVAKRWEQQGIPPLLLARNPYFNSVREKHFMADLGL